MSTETAAVLTIVWLVIFAMAAVALMRRRAERRAREAIERECQRRRDAMNAEFERQEARVVRMRRAGGPGTPKQPQPVATTPAHTGTFDAAPAVSAALDIGCHGTSSGIGIGDFGGGSCH